MNCTFTVFSLLLMNHWANPQWLCSDLVQVALHVIREKSHLSFNVGRLTTLGLCGVCGCVCARAWVCMSQPTKLTEHILRLQSTYFCFSCWYKSFKKAICTCRHLCQMHSRTYAHTHTHILTLLTSTNTAIHRLSNIWRRIVTQEWTREEWALDTEAAVFLQHQQLHSRSSVFLDMRVFFLAMWCARNFREILPMSLSIQLLSDKKNVFIIVI